jgi:hypothetical protein
MRLRNLLRVRRWALVARVGAHQFHVWSWHLTYGGAVRRRTYHRTLSAGRDASLWVYPWRKLDDLPGEVVR